MMENDTVYCVEQKDGREDWHRVTEFFLLQETAWAVARSKKRQNVARYRVAAYAFVSAEEVHKCD